jgi:hypothetical protein
MFVSLLNSDSFDIAATNSNDGIAIDAKIAFILHIIDINVLSSIAIELTTFKVLLNTKATIQSALCTIFFDEGNSDHFTVGLIDQRGEGFRAFHFGSFTFVEA